MADTRVVSSTNLVSQESIKFIRPNTLILTLIEARPNTKMYVFFDDQNVTDKCHPASINWAASTKVTLRQVIKSGNNYYQVTTGGTTSTVAPTHTSGTATNGTATLQYVSNIATLPLITDTIGQLRIQFNVDGGTYSTGDKTITIADTPTLSNLNTVNSVFGSAKATFHSTGRLDIMQETQTTITTVERVVNVQRDPLAQSFFTYGVSGGIFLSSIDIYFQTKDDTVPVRLEIREMINGYPAPIDSTNPILVSVVEPANVNLSANASAPTKFTFNPPVYLQEESEFCFVLRSNSNNYNVYTSRMNEKSLEDGRKIFEQPYIGSLFKSENNVTWTAEQFEDIKFTINKCVFDTSTDGALEFSTLIPAVGALGDQFSTVSGSNVITYKHNHDHGLEVGSKFHIVTRTDSLYANASFNGIPYAQFNATHTVTSVPTRNTLTFAVTSNATSTGKLTSSSVLSYVGVESEGINYSSSDTVVFSGGGGSGAAATLTVVDGNIKSVNITNAGTSYESAPEITIVTSTGTGAVLTTSVLPTFSVYTNKPMTGFTAKINTMNFGESSSNNLIRTTLGNYDGGNLVTYNAGIPLGFVEYNPYVNIGQNSLIASSYNETAMMSGNTSAKVEINLTTQNPNVSPVINVNTKPLLHAHYNRINQQSNETISSTNFLTSVESIIISNPGSGYLSAPTITISAPTTTGGIQATATATVSGGVITAITLTNVGSGYSSKPTVTVSGGSGSGAVLEAVMTEVPGTGSVKSIAVTAAGSGYTVDPVVTISAPNISGGIQATATASRTGSAINAIVITNPGSGYTEIPLVTITRGSGDTTGTGGAAQATLTPYNTELMSTGGSAKARYITKRVTVQVISSGIRIYSAISSVQGSSVDWYVRTSLTGSSVSHDDQPWKILKCDTVRNKSSYIGQVFDYEFYLNDIDKFDTYDLKCVLTSQDPTKAPIVDSYRVIVLA